MKNGLPILLKHFKETLRYKVVRGVPTLGYSVFYIDLSSWKLNLSELTPVIWVKDGDQSDFTPRELFQSLQDVVRERSMGRQTVLVILDMDGAEFKQYTANLSSNFVIIDINTQKQIVHSSRATGELRDAIIGQLSLINLSPFEINSPVTGSRFFGREYEIMRILDRLRTDNFAILGIRRIGKTSLLLEVRRRLLEEDSGYPVFYMDCSDMLSTDSFVREVVRHFNIRDINRLHRQRQQYSVYFPNFLKRMHKKYGREIVLLLDEIDNVLIIQRGDWTLFNMLRKSAIDNDVRIVIAGFREAMQESYLFDSPLANFVDIIRLREFTFKQANKLVFTPMENLGIRFKNKGEVIRRIYEETAGHPNLIQYYCHVLLKKMDDSGDRIISPDSLQSVYADRELMNRLIMSFLYNTKNREKAIVYLLLMENEDVYTNGFTQDKIDNLLKKQRIEMTQIELEQACAALALAGVFLKRGKEYFFHTPVFTKALLNEYNLRYLLQKALDEGL